MAHIARDLAYEKFLALGRNSSHFVWFLTRLEFFETSRGWVFAYCQRGPVTLFALEPLVPDPAAEEAEFPLAWKEVQEALQPKIAFFVSVYDRFLAHLRHEGFQTLQIGREPYVELANCIPTGKSGKGVRAARNQALRAGVTVEELPGDEILSRPKLRQEMQLVIKQWKARKVLELGGGLNTVNPFESMQLRRYFLASSQGGRLEGFLVATPIPGERSYFLEDLVLREGSSRGAGELLTLEAMATLAESGARFASLGVVAITSMTKESARGLPALAELALVKIPHFLSRFYNVGGLETFRKRFKPQRWEQVHLALRNFPRSGVSDNRAWLSAMLALLGSFTPRLNISWRWPIGELRHLVAKHPVSTFACLISALSFGLINHGGTLPEPVLRTYGFSGDSPLWEWFYRTFTSDFLYFDLSHFISSVLFLFFLLRWMERSYPIRFGAATVIGLAFFDDFFNQLVLVAPYRYFQPRLFEHLVTYKDVGPSLWIAAVLGLQLCTLRKYREILFALVSVMLILVFAFSATHLFKLVINLNHSLFFAVGFIIGKLRFEYDRIVSRRMAKRKPPVAKSVAGPPQRRATDRKPAVTDSSV